ncbi:FMN-dependent dehydrogenase-domain-containing protein [Daldinia bambusicola]|nr:FMN-dependent dehydrogenase-domain-containing protein [Daldinia bambusicola]
MNGGPVLSKSKKPKQSISVEEISQYRSLKDLWLVVDGIVYNLSEFSLEHPGGSAVLLDHAGRDAKGGALGRLMGGFIDATLTWDDISWVRRHAPGLPIAPTGIQTEPDAVRAMEVRVDTIYISNHGGRSLDTSPATILVLLEIQKCCLRVFDRMEVYVDGGITRGTDIFKALCLGAREVGIVRGFFVRVELWEGGR